MRIRQIGAALAALQAVLLISLPSSSRAGALTGVEVMTSTVMQKQQTAFSGLAARVSLQPMAGVQGLELLPTIEYWRSTTSVDIYSIKSERRDATLDLDARYKIPAKGWSPYVGAGLAIHFLSSEVQAPQLGVPDQQHSVTKGGAVLLGGVDFPLAGVFSSFIEGKYHAVPDEEQFKLNWGLAIAFH
jgi:hypothetical protein